MGDMSGTTVLPGEPDNPGGVTKSGHAVTSCPVPQGPEVDPRLWDLTMAAQAGLTVPRLTFLTSSGVLIGQLGSPDHFAQRSYQSLEAATWHEVHGFGQARTRKGRESEAAQRAEVDSQLWASLAPVAGASDESVGPIATLYEVDLFAQAGHVQLAAVRLALTQVIAWWACRNKVINETSKGGGGGFGVGVGVVVPLDF